jgi:CTP-dependent riboflavin kinase
LNTKVWVILPEEQRHKDVIEVISDARLRTKFDLRDGDEVEIEIYDAK